MLRSSGRVYHPAPEKAGGVGLIKSSIAIELSKSFEFASDDETLAPTHFTWRNTRYTLNNKVLEKLYANGRT